MQILARRQPAASDLRMVIAVIKTITDLERIGDEAERIAKMALSLAEDDVVCHNHHAGMRYLGNQVKYMMHWMLTHDWMLMQQSE